MFHISWISFLIIPQDIKNRIRMSNLIVEHPLSFKPNFDCQLSESVTNTVGIIKQCF